MDVIFDNWEEITTFEFKFLNVSNKSLSDGLEFEASEHEVEKNQGYDAKIEEQNINENNNFFMILFINLDIRLISVSIIFLSEHSDNRGLGPADRIEE